MNSSKTERRLAKGEQKRRGNKCTNYCSTAQQPAAAPTTKSLEFKRRFRPLSVKFRKKWNNMSLAIRHRPQYNSLPNITVADDGYEKYPCEKKRKLSTLYTFDTVEVLDYRSSDNSEDEQLVLWYQDSRLGYQHASSDSEATSAKNGAQPLRQYKFADTSGDKKWLDEKVLEPYPYDVALSHPQSLPYYDVEFQSLQRRQWIEESHRVSEIIRMEKSSRLFVVNIRNRPRNMLVHLRLGYCITYEGHCVFTNLCTSLCVSCCVCSHQYKCTCQKNKRFGWCAHMHAAVVSGEHRFGADTLVYYSISSRRMQESHLRATCFDMAGDVRCIGANHFGVPENGTKGMLVEPVFQVMRNVDAHHCNRCPRYKRCPECNICRHTYQCNCANYLYGNLLCEHCHLVAISQSVSRDYELMFHDFEYASDQSDATDDDEYVTPFVDDEHMNRLVYKIEMHHQRSHGNRLDKVVATTKDGTPCYTFASYNGQNTWNVKKPVRFCQCEEDLMNIMKCYMCRICVHCFVCDCQQSSDEICKHKHVASRFFSNTYDLALEKQFEEELKRKMSDAALLAARQERRVRVKRGRRLISSMDVWKTDLTRCCGQRESGNCVKHFKPANATAPKPPLKTSQKGKSQTKRQPGLTDNGLKESTSQMDAGANENSVVIKLLDKDGCAGSTFDLPTIPSETDKSDNFPSMKNILQELTKKYVECGTRVPSVEESKTQSDLWPVSARPVEKCQMKVQPACMPVLECKLNARPVAEFEEQAKFMPVSESVDEFDDGVGSAGVSNEESQNCESPTDQFSSVLTGEANEGATFADKSTLKTAKYDGSDSKSSSTSQSSDKFGNGATSFDPLHDVTEIGVGSESKAQPATKSIRKSDRSFGTEDIETRAINLSEELDDDAIDPPNKAFNEVLRMRPMKK